MTRKLAVDLSYLAMRADPGGVRLLRSMAWLDMLPISSVSARALAN